MSYESMLALDENNPKRGVKKHVLDKLHTVRPMQVPILVDVASRLNGLKAHAEKTSITHRAKVLKTPWHLTRSCHPIGTLISPARSSSVSIVAEFHVEFIKIGHNWSGGTV